MGEGPFLRKKLLREFKLKIIRPKFICMGDRGGLCHFLEILPLLKYLSIGLVEAIGLNMNVHRPTSKDNEISQDILL